VRGIPRAVLAMPPASTTHLDEMHGPASLPYRPGRASRKPSPDDAGASSESRIFQPTSSREAALGHSTGGKPGHRGGWKKG
jgi:excinuclease ABC subunit B